MKNLILFSFILIISGFQSINAQSDDDINYILNQYVSFLKTEGYSPEIEAEEVKFKREGRTYWIAFADENIFKISRYLALDDDQDCSKSLYALLNDFHWNRIAERTRLYDSCQTLEISSVSHLGSTEDWKKILDRSMIWLDYGVREFWELYDELK